MKHGDIQLLSVKWENGFVQLTNCEDVFFYAKLSIMLVASDIRQWDDAWDTQKHTTSKNVFVQTRKDK